MSALKFHRHGESLRAHSHTLHRCADDLPAERRGALLDVAEQLRVIAQELQAEEQALHDYNEQLHAVQRLLELERRRYRELFEFAPDGYLVTDMDGAVREVNQAAAQLLNVAQTSLPGMSLINFIAREERRAFRDRLMRLRYVERMTHEWVVQIWPHDAAPWDAELTVGVMRDDYDRPVALRWMLRDVTERKLTEERLQRARDELENRVRERTKELVRLNQTLQDEIGERKRAQQSLARQARKLSRSEEDSRQQAGILQSVLNSMREGVVMIDADGKFLLVNQAAQQMAGPDMKIDGTMAERIRHHDLFLPDKITPYPSHDLPLMRALRGEEVDGVEMFVRHPRDLWLSVNARPVRDAAGAVCGAVAVFTDITEHKLAEQRLISLAQYDPLTGLPNRALFRDRLSQAMARAARSQRLVALMFLDLDHFKDINDSLGHHAGDMVLKAMGERLRDCLRDGDTIARLGGDEFTMILENMESVEDVAEVAQKVLTGLAQPLFVEGREVLLTTSIGITLYPMDINGTDNMLKKADIAMYHAKDQGRNNYQFYTPEMTVRASERLSMEGKLRHALERDEFLLYYQPQIDLNSGKIVGVEALLRWRHPELGLIPSARFIPLAEKTGLIVPISEWVLHTACMQNKRWQDAGLATLCVATNQSARQFKHPNLVATIDAALKNSGLEARYLDLEITEDLLMENTRASSGIIAEIKAMGVHISVDDFGTGYSSLSYLKHFPLDSLKIDQSFVQNIPHNAHDAAIATAIITLAHNLELRVIAEGVETEEQKTFLHAQGCEGMQGYLFSRPLPAEEFTRMLEQRKLRESQVAG
ncbi:MAG: EAL domain-containing protein [Pseudomonadota bacterium]